MAPEPARDTRTQVVVPLRAELRGSNDDDVSGAAAWQHLQYDEQLELKHLKAAAHGHPCPPATPAFAPPTLAAARAPLDDHTRPPLTSWTSGGSGVEACESPRQEVVSGGGRASAWGQEQEQDKDKRGGRGEGGGWSRFG